MLLLIAGVGLLVLMLVGPSLGSPALILGLTLGSLAVIPGRLWGPVDPTHVGIAGGYVTLATYAPIILVGQLWLMARNRTGLFPRAFLPLVAYLLLGLYGLWGNTLEQRAGVVALVLGAMAWGLGSNLAREARAHRVEYWLVVAILLVWSVQLGVELLQSTGHQIFAPGLADCESD